MTDRLAEIIAAHKHYRNLGDSYQTERCTGCDWALNPGFLAPLVAGVRLHAAHVAEKVRAELAVIELPAPVNGQPATEDENGWQVWWSPLVEAATVFDDGDIYYREFTTTAEQLKGHAVALLAAAVWAEKGAR